MKEVQLIELVSHNKSNTGIVSILNMLTDLAIHYSYYPTISAFLVEGDRTGEISQYLRTADITYSMEYQDNIRTCNKFKLFCSD